jgi:anaerobic dimethyl sulfoxide reductase subunit B (iron-sulfur subunit)
MKQYGFYFNQDRCIGCHTCEVSCKDWNGINPGEPAWRTVKDTEYDMSTNSVATSNTRLADFDRYYISYSCNHCANPACVEACAVKAIIKRKDGVVLIDQNKCIALQQCVAACPFAAPHIYTVDGALKAKKCTMCFDRIEQGKKPICVNACIQRALDFDTLDALKEKYTTGSITAIGFPADNVDQNGNELQTPTGPSMLFKTR